MLRAVPIAKRCPVHPVRVDPQAPKLTPPWCGSFHFQSALPSWVAKGRWEGPGKKTVKVKQVKLPNVVFPLKSAILQVLSGNLYSYGK